MKFSQSMMDGLQALRLVARDLWEEASLLLLVGLIGALLSLLILPLPFVLAAHYATAARISEDRVVSLSSWFSEGWANARFYYAWVVVLGLVAAVFVSAILFYGRITAPWAMVLRWLCAVFLAIWLFPQPYVPALYWQQEDRRLRTALRNAFLITGRDPFSQLIWWILLLLLGGLMAYYIWPLLLILPVLAAVYATRVLQLKVSAVPRREE